MDKLEVKFYDTVNDELLKFAVIISQGTNATCSLLCKLLMKRLPRLVRGSL